MKNASVPSLRLLIERASSALLTLPNDEVDGALGAEAPSARTLVGELIDAAATAQERLEWAWEHGSLALDARSPAGADADDAWQGAYGEADWAGLVTLWWMHATHLLRTLERIPDDVRRRPHHPHGLHALAWRPVPEDEPATLDDLVWDYGTHARHHLAQLLPGLEDDVPSPHENR